MPDAVVALDVLANLLAIARPGALFPDVKRVGEWLSLSHGGGKAAPKLSSSMRPRAFLDHALAAAPARPAEGRARLVRGPRREGPQAR